MSLNLDKKHLREGNNVKFYRIPLKYKINPLDQFKGREKLNYISQKFIAFIKYNFFLSSRVKQLKCPQFILLQFYEHETNLST